MKSAEANFRQRLHELSLAVAKAGIFLHVEDENLSRLHCMEAAAEAVPISFSERFGDDHPIAATCAANLVPNDLSATVYFTAGNLGGKKADRASIGARISKTASQLGFVIHWIGSGDAAITLVPQSIN